jgi:lipopolysaccharide/colanic/teichoic acid biosynthesis glycosyltransferase
LFDFLVSLLVVLIFVPVGLIALLAVYLEDRNKPIYAPWRVGLGGRLFRMYKIRTMTPNADRTKVDSTSVRDPRITRVGAMIRSSKLDEMLQFINVLTGSMSIVGPRPNLDREVDLYTLEERRLLDVRPGVSDLSSIVFSDLGDILEHSSDPNLDYNQLVRPWKGRLAMVYVDHGTIAMYFKIIWLTALNSIDRPRALRGVVNILQGVNASTQLIEVAARFEPLQPHPPLGSNDIVQSRDPT